MPHHNRYEYYHRESDITRIQAQSPDPSMGISGEKIYQNIAGYPLEYYILLEYINGQALNSWYEEQVGTFNTPSSEQIHTFLKTIFLPICHHIQFVHEKGILHRDLARKNIMIMKENGDIYIAPKTYHFFC